MPMLMTPARHAQALRQGLNGCLLAPHIVARHAQDTGNLHFCQGLHQQVQALFPGNAANK